MTLTRAHLILFATFSSAALLGGAFLFQLAGYAPCAMCFWQRWPHGIIAVLGLAALATKNRLLCWVGAFGMLISAGLGAYHSGVERKWWPGPSSCTGGGDLGGSATDLLDSILSTPVVMCDEIPWRLSDWIPLQILDLTMANFNAVISLVLAGIWVQAARMK